MGTVRGGCVCRWRYTSHLKARGGLEGVKLITAGEYGVVSTGATRSEEKNLEMLASRRKVCRNLRDIVYVLSVLLRLEKEGRKTRGGRVLTKQTIHTR